MKRIPFFALVLFICSHATIGSSTVLPKIQWHLDESSWNGTTNEVTDSSGNNNSGTTVNGTSPNSSSPAITGSVGTCGYASFDGNDDYITANSLDILKGTSSLSFWIRTTQTGNSDPFNSPGITGVEQAGGTDDIFWGWLDNSGHIGISVGTDSSAKSTKSTIAINDGNFHHVVLTRDASSGAYAIYIDGNLNKSGTTGTGVIGTSFSSIGRIEDTGGSPEYFQGDLDEIQAFSSIISLSDVQSLMNETHACPTSNPVPSTACNILPTNYAMYGAEKILLYNNTITVNGNTVNHQNNSSPNIAIDLNGTVSTNNSPNFPALSPSTFPANTTWNINVPSVDTSFNSEGEAYYGAIILNSPNTSASFTGGGPFHIKYLATNNENATINLAAGTYYINDLTLNGKNSKINITSSPVYLHIGDRFWINPFSTVGINTAEINSNGNVEDFIVYMHSNSYFASAAQYLNFTGLIYGPEAANIVFYSGNINFHGAIITGRGNITIAGTPFTQTYTSADQAAINALSNCDTTLDHFELNYAKNGLTCLPSAITLKACADTSCSSLYTGDVITTLSPASGWSNNPVTISSGSDIVSFQPSSAGNVTLAVNSSTVAPSTDLQCYADNVLDATCSINFSDAGFVFDVPTLTACKPSADVTIKAVKKSETSTQCVGALTGTQSIDFWANYTSPNNGNNSVLINGSDIKTTSTDNMTRTAIDLTFDANGQASFTTQYDDAGQLKLNAEHTLSNNAVLSGSDTFISKPVALAVFTNDANAECTTVDANCSAFKKAGESFNLKVNAACWTDDSDTDFTDNPITPNFELSSIVNTHNLLAPSAGSAGTLSNKSFNFTTSDNGSHTVSQTVSEVGVFQFGITAPSYFGESITTVVSPAIGRFYPDHFKLTTQSNGSFGAHACSGFSYSGQSFSYQTSPQLTVSAYSALNPATITQNYTGDFAKLTISDFSVTTPTTDANQLGVDATNRVRLLWTADAPDLTDNANGTLTFAFGNDSYSYLHEPNSLIDEFTNAVDLTFTAISDSDNVDAQDLPYTLQPTGEPIRFGRFAISSAHGSELAPLALSLTAEYFNGINWVDNNADQCTTLSLASDLQLANPQTAGGSWQAGNSTMTIANGTTSGSLTNNAPLLNGTATLTLSAPGEDNEGYVDLRSQLSITAPWLLGDYDNDGHYDDNPTGRASFGLFKGSDNIIFRRELY